MKTQENMQGPKEIQNAKISEKDNTEMTIKQILKDAQIIAKWRKKPFYIV